MISPRTVITVSMILVLLAGVATDTSAAGVPTEITSPTPVIK